MDKTMTFKAIVYKISTLPDGGTRLTFDVSDADNEAVKNLMDYKGQVVNLVAMDEHFTPDNRT